MSSFFCSLLECAQAEGSSTVFSIWLCGLVAIILLSWTASTMEVSKEDHILLQIFRKSYHIIALCIFLPSGLYNLPLMQFGLVLSACGFIALEAVRLSMKQSWLGRSLNGFVGTFVTEEEEKGSAILPHLYLLLGCAIPILISSTHNSIHAYSGLFSLCITDAFVTFSQYVMQYLQIYFI